MPNSAALPLASLLTSIVASWSVGGTAIDLPDDDATIRDDDATIVEGPVGAKADGHLAALAGKGFSGTVLVAIGGKIVLRKGYGLANRAEGWPCEPDTVYCIGSITKQFTAAAILVLEQAKKLSVDDPLSKHLEDVPADKQSITLHHLLTHTAGFPEEIGRDYEPIEREAWLKKALATKLISAPGARYRYSNVGFSVLAALVERISGESCDEFFAKHLFEPAGMEHTGCVLPSWDTRKLAVGYRGGETWGTPLDHEWAEDGPYWNMRGNGGVLSTATDMLRWHSALLGDAVLDAKEREKLFTPYVAEDASGLTHYAYGWVIAKAQDGSRVITHNGGNGYFFADYFRIPERDLVVFLATNDSSSTRPDVGEQLARVVFAAQPQ
jgi:CubicO group peptidase (beta-lactamase class C family)